MSNEKTVLSSKSCGNSDAIAGLLETISEGLKGKDGLFVMEITISQKYRKEYARKEKNKYQNLYPETNEKIYTK
ncbi:TPA_asm: hypothetical protein [Altiarchaeum virus]|nr:TPA_asm: hypothetical protein [Altiarchaeum virus]